MSDLRTSPVGMSAVPASARTPQGRAMLRKAVGEVLGTIFIGGMLRTARNSAIRGKYGHGGRGERVFRAQLDELLAQKIGGRMQNRLTDAICDRLGGKKGV